MKKSEVIATLREKLPGIDYETILLPYGVSSIEEIDTLKAADLKQILSAVGGGDESTESQSTGELVPMFRQDRGEVMAESDDVPNMLKNGWAISSDVPGTGGWVRIADLASLGYYKR
jgi:hypothetical protein